MSTKYFSCRKLSVPATCCPTHAPCYTTVPSVELEPSYNTGTVVVERVMSLFRKTARALKARIWKYFSGRLALVQLTAGLGALALRSLAVYATLDFESWQMVMAGIIGSFTGYVSSYVLGYWAFFRRDYRTSGRSMLFDVFRLQLVEQLPNIWTVVGSGLTQGALIEGTDMPPVLAVNIGSWFGPQKILNIAAMLTSNSLKRAWVDGTWRPLTAARRPVRALHRLGGKLRFPGAKERPGNAQGLPSLPRSTGIQSDDPARDEDD